MTTTLHFPHPAWCDSHDGFDDGSGDWHQSKEVFAGNQRFYVSTGTHTGDPEVFLFQVESDGITLDEAETLATELLAAVAAVRAGAER